MSAFRQAILDLVPVVRKRAEDAERERKLPGETIASLRELGVFRAFVPTFHGGDERSLCEVLDAMTELAVGCASTAWVASITAVHNIAACWLEKPGREEIFGDGPDVVIASSVAPTGMLVRASNGFRLAGRWGFSSGVDYASWIMLGATLKEGPPSSPADYFLSFVRASEVTLIDDWYSAGLRATGSKSLELKDVFVPNCRALALNSLSQRLDQGVAPNAIPLYRLPWNPLLSSAFPPAALGTAIATLERFRECTATRISRFSGRTLRANVGVATRLAEAAAQIDAARLLFLRDISELDDRSRDGEGLSPGAVERIPFDVSFVVDRCSRVVLQLFRGSGGRAIYENNPLQRHFRDIHAMTQHAAMDADGTGETYGRALLLNRSSIGVFR